MEKLIAVTLRLCLFSPVGATVTHNRNFFSWASICSKAPPNIVEQPALGRDFTVKKRKFLSAIPRPIGPPGVNSKFSRAQRKEIRCKGHRGNQILPIEFVGKLVKDSAVHQLLCACVHLF